MPGKLVRRIRTTTVQPQQEPEDVALTGLERERLAAFREANETHLQLRRVGLSPTQIRNLEVLRWEVQAGRVVRG